MLGDEDARGHESGVRRGERGVGLDDLGSSLLALGKVDMGGLSILYEVQFGTNIWDPKGDDWGLGQRDSSFFA